MAVDYYVQAEESLQLASYQLEEDAWRSAAMTIGDDRWMRRLFSKEHLQQLSLARSGVDAWIPCLWATWSFQLSLVARVQVLSPAEQPFTHLLEGVNFSINPGGRLVRWLMDLVELRTLSRLMALDTRADAMMDDSALKRWSAGHEFPSHKKIFPFARAVLKAARPATAAEDYVAFSRQYWAARRLRKIADAMYPLFELRQPAFGMDAPLLLWAWADGVFSLWVDYWQSERAAATRT